MGDMKKLQGQWVDVYYEKEKTAAEDVFQYADAETKDIAKKLGFHEKQNVNIYIYDFQSTMQRKKLRFIVYAVCEFICFPTDAHP